MRCRLKSKLDKIAIAMNGTAQNKLKIAAIATEHLSHVLFADNQQSDTS